MLSNGKSDGPHQGVQGIVVLQTIAWEFVEVLRGPIVLKSFVLIEKPRLECKRERTAYVCSPVRKMRVNKT